jgi:hypothetical protein
VLYKIIGKAVVKLLTAFVLRDYGRRLRIAGAVGVVGAGIVAYVIASRDVEEG